MKKLLILFTILTLTNLNAQEKQNDATWEETISFLNKYSDMLMRFDNRSSVMDWTKFTNVKFQNKDNTTFLILEYSLNPQILITNYDLKYLDKVEWQEKSKVNSIDWSNWKDVITIKFTRPQPYIFDGKKRGTYKQHAIKISDSEINERYFKALKHLAYLAKKKREEIRKNSGDKF